MEIGSVSRIPTEVSGLYQGSPSRPANQPVKDQPEAAAPQSTEPDAKSADNPERAAKELTTVTTHCSKPHQHTKACPHTVTTRPAGKLDRYV